MVMSHEWSGRCGDSRREFQTIVATAFSFLQHAARSVDGSPGLSAETWEREVATQLVNESPVVASWRSISLLNNAEE